MGLFDSIFGSTPKKTRRKSTKVAAGNNWKSLEKKGEKSKYFRGCKLETQKRSKSTGKRPDYFCTDPKNPRRRIVGDAKNVKRVTKKEIDKVKSYAGHPYYATERVLVTNKSAKLSRADKKYAKERNVKIDRISAKSPRKKKSWWDS
ncbi:MAG: hypothetical protein IIA83_01210 [Thaumarchaeota archaeon]|nr:hypothetical protein [Nitrososphaerota archaeon]